MGSVKLGLKLGDIYSRSGVIMVKKDIGKVLDAEKKALSSISAKDNEIKKRIASLETGLKEETSTKVEARRTELEKEKQNALLSVKEEAKKIASSGDSDAKGLSETAAARKEKAAAALEAHVIGG